MQHDEDDMGLSIYGFSSRTFATGEYMEGPRASLSGSDEIQAELIIATMIYILSDRPRDAFLMGEEWNRRRSFRERHHRLLRVFLRHW